jgi:hypothetical protein
LTLHLFPRLEGRPRKAMEIRHLSFSFPPVSFGIMSQSHAGGTHA